MAKQPRLHTMLRQKQLYQKAQEKEGYTFAGWYTDSKFSENIICKMGQE